MTVAVLFLAFFGLLLLEVPISIALIVAAFAGVAVSPDITFHLIPRTMHSAMNAFPLLAIPFFVMAGGIMGRGGMSRRLIDLASSLVGNVRGGLAITAVVACMLFAAISGSTAATTAAIGSIMIPAIVNSGFSRPAATSLLATSGSIGIVIPPSIPFVLMGWIGGMSIGRLFLAGVVPGLLIGLCLMVVCYITAVVQGHPTSGHPFNLRETLRRFREAFLALLAVVLVIGGIMFGFVTATEAGVVAVFYGLIVSKFVYRELKWSDLYPIMVDTAKITGIVVLCIAAASPFAWLLTVEQVPARVSEAVLATTQNAALIKLMMLVLLLVIGTFLDVTPAMLIFVPIFLPIATKVGMDPIHFGVMVVMALGIGQCTPPVGIALFVACSVSGARIDQLFRSLAPYLAAMIVAVIIATYCPPVALWFPNLFMAK